MKQELEAAAAKIRAVCEDVSRDLEPVEVEARGGGSRANDNPASHAVGKIRLRLDRGEPTNALLRIAARVQQLNEEEAALLAEASDAANPPAPGQ